MITNTKCQKCLFADKVSSDNPCQHNIIDHVKSHKKIRIEDDFYVIENYVCKMGFDKNTYEEHKDKVSLEAIKQEIVNRACIAYYLLMDISSLNPQELERFCNSLISLSIRPKFISFLLFPDEHNKEKIFTLKRLIDKEFMWKAHSFISEISVNDAIHVALDTNVGQNNTNYLLIYDPNKIEELDSDINEINSDIIIMQKPFHYGKKIMSSDLNGLFMTFNNYNVCRSIDKDIKEALSTVPGAVVLEYGSK